MKLLPSRDHSQRLEQDEHQQRYAESSRMISSPCLTLCVTSWIRRVLSTWQRLHEIFSYHKPTALRTFSVWIEKGGEGKMSWSNSRSVNICLHLLFHMPLGSVVNEDFVKVFMRNFIRAISESHCWGYVCVSPKWNSNSIHVIRKIVLFIP